MSGDPLVSQISKPGSSETVEGFEPLNRLPECELTESPWKRERSTLLRHYGDFTLAYSACHQEGIRHFGDADGMIAYAQRLGHTFVLVIR